MTPLREHQLQNLLVNQTFVIWVLPDNEVRKLCVYEIYRGLKQQLRVGFVDRHGRVFHYDVSEVRIFT